MSKRCEKNLMYPMCSAAVQLENSCPGDVYLQCATTDDATNVMRAMGHRKYDGRPVRNIC